jgi:hypothetical protein
VRARDCQESCVRGRLISHARNLSSNMIANGLFILTLLCNDGVRETGQAQLPSDLLFRLRQAAPRFC